MTNLYTYPNTAAGYSQAEKHADSWAGDDNTTVVVVEDFGRNQFHVLEAKDLAGWLVEAGIDRYEIQYDTDYEELEPAYEVVVERRQVARFTVPALSAADAEENWVELTDELYKNDRAAYEARFQNEAYEVLATSEVFPAAVG